MNAPATKADLKALKAGETHFNAYPNRATRRRGDATTGPAIEQVVYTKADIRSAHHLAREIGEGRLELSEEHQERLYDVIKYAEHERESNRTRRQMVRHYANPANRVSHNQKHHNGKWNGAFGMDMPMNDFRRSSSYEYLGDGDERETGVVRPYDEGEPRTPNEIEGNTPKAPKPTFSQLILKRLFAK